MVGIEIAWLRSMLVKRCVYVGQSCVSQTKLTRRVPSALVLLGIRDLVRIL